MSAEEIAVFNYLYNTNGDYNGYLDNMSSILDTRYDAKLCQEDEDYANEHPVLASASSVILSPVEGMNAIAATINSKINNGALYYADIHNHSSVYRGTVSSNINTNYGDFASLMYDTGMSMADSGLMIGVGSLTGGSSAVVGTIAGTSVYGQSLYSAKQRGLSDNQAIVLASANALNESIGEVISASKFFQLAGGFEQNKSFQNRPNQNRN